MKVALEVSLRKQREAEDYREVLEVCHNEVLRLGSLAERLLTLSRLDSEQYGLRMVPSEISEIVNSALEPIRSRAKECALELSVRLQEAEVNCDPEAIRQVVDNLIDNALRHAPSGGTVEIELTLTQGEVEFAVVNDQGHLNLDSEARLFDRFYRSDSSRDRKTGGAGLPQLVHCFVMTTFHMLDSPFMLVTPPARQPALYQASMCQERRWLWAPWPWLFHTP